MPSLLVSKIQQALSLLAEQQGAVLAFAVAFVVVAIIAINRSLALRVPKGFTKIPGPPGLPVSGHSFLVPVSNPQVQFQRWAKQYGEIFQIQLGLQKWVFLNSAEAAKDVIDKQSVLTSSRPPMPSADIISGHRRMLLMPYGPEWRNLRGIIHTMFTPKASETFKPSQEFEAKQMLADMANSIEDHTAFYQHVRRYTTSVILTSTYGFRVPVWDCEDVNEIYGLMSEFSQVTSPVYSLLDMFPGLLKLPKSLHWWENRYAVMRERQNKIWGRYWNDMKRKIDQGIAPDCFGRQLVEAGYSKKGIDELQAAFVAGTMIEAGSETTSGTFNSLVLYLMSEPGVVRKAQEEIAEVVGDDRSPTWDDEEKLPYIRAIVKEILRIRPVASVGSPHYSDDSLSYKNYYIPKNTVVTLFQYGLHNDPRRWERPEKFYPERYLGYNLKAGQYVGQGDPNRRDHWSFGGGRRICPGMHLAENSLYIMCAKFLWAYTPLPSEGAQTNSAIPFRVTDDMYERGTTTLPKPFKCHLIFRNDKVAETVQREWAEARRKGYNLGNKHVDEHGIVTGATKA